VESAKCKMQFDSGHGRVAEDKAVRFFGGARTINRTDQTDRTDLTDRNGKVSPKAHIMQAIEEWNERKGFE